MSQESVSQKSMSQKGTSQHADFRTDQAFTAISLVTVIAGIVAGFWLLGSPSQQRLISLDKQRLQDLQQIAYSLQFPPGGTEPDLPEQLPSARNGFTNRNDPDTGEPYEYERLSESSYNLCATFATDSQAQTKTGFNPSPNWPHPAGRHCFEIDATTAQPK